jgi:PAS domain S-box-containing protein
VAASQLWGGIPQPAPPLELVRDGLLGATSVVLSLALVWLAVRAIEGHEARLAEGEARYRALTENAPDLIAELDADGSTIYASPGYERVLGYTSDEMMRRRLESVVHPDDVASARRSSRRSCAASKNVTLRLRHRDGAWRWFDFEEACSRTRTTRSGS